MPERILFRENENKLTQYIKQVTHGQFEDTFSEGHIPSSQGTHPARVLPCNYVLNDGAFPERSFFSRCPQILLSRISLEPPGSGQPGVKHKVPVPFFPFPYHPW